MKAKRLIKQKDYDRALKVLKKLSKICDANGFNA
jgi:hypothetical protein